jgi:hypothetical protein
LLKCRPCTQVRSIVLLKYNRNEVKKMKVEDSKRWQSVTIGIVLTLIIVVSAISMMVQTGRGEVQTASANEDYVKRLDISSNEDTIIIHKDELEIEAEKTELIEFEEVLFTVRAPPYQLFNFSTTHSEAVVMTSNVDNPLCLAPGEVVTMDTVSGTCNATTDEEGLFKFVVFFIENRTYTFRVWCDALTYEDAEEHKKDDIDINVSKLKVEIRVYDNAVAEIGEEVEIRGISNRGKRVDIVINDILAFDNVTGRTSSIRLGKWGFTVTISTNVTVPEASLIINGTAMGTNHVDIITISPKGGGGAGLYEKSYPDVPGITNESIPVGNNSFSKTINVSEHADVGKYVIWVAVPGRDNYYGNWYSKGVNTSDKLIKQIIDDFCGGDADGLRTKTQDQILAVLQDATYEAIGSDDLACIAELNVGEREFEARWNTTGKDAGVYEIDVYVDCEELTSDMVGTNVKDVLSEYDLEPDDKAWIVLVNRFLELQGSDDLYFGMDKAFVGMEEAGIPTSPDEGNYNDFLYHPDHWYNKGKGVIGDNASVTYKVLMGAVLNFTGNCTGETIVGYAPEEIKGNTYGIASHNYDTQFYFTVEGTYYVDIDGNFSYDEGTDVLLSVDEPKIEVKIRDEKGKEIEATTIDKNITVDLETNLFDDDVVKLKIWDPDGVMRVHLVDTIENVRGKSISTKWWDVGTYKIWIDTVEEKARGLDIESDYATITLRKPEIEIESEIELPPEVKEVMFTVRAPPYTLFNFSTSHPAEVVMTAKWGNPLNLSEGEEVRMDEVGGIFNATADYVGLYNFVVYFTEERTYTFMVWYGASTYWEADYDDSIDVEVGDIITAIKIPDTSVAVVGEDVTIRVVAPAGDYVDMYIDGFLWFDDEPLIDGKFEVIWDTSGIAVGSHDIHVYVDCPYTFADKDELPEGIEADGSKTIRLIEPWLKAEQRRNVVAVGDDYTIEGMATGVDEVDIVIIGPNGFIAMSLDVENGLEFLSTSVTEGNAFNEDICIPEDADFGEYKVGVFAPGRDGVYGTTWCGAGELMDAILEEYGIEVENLVGKNQTQLLDMIADATIDKVGGDDLAEILNFTAELPYVRFSDVRDVPAGEPLKVSGVTNREPKTTVTINSTIEYLTPHPLVIPTKVKWPRPNYGVFNVTINTTDAKPGIYTLIADDGEGNINITTVELLSAISVFDTGEGTYPSIMGTHKGAIKPSSNITVNKLYTYPFVGTGGHTESIELYDENEVLIAHGTWNVYVGDWHNITIHNISGAPYVILLKDHQYNYTIVTGSYPQIIHEPNKEVTGGTITSTSFVDANGKRYTDWIPAIRLE